MTQNCQIDCLDCSIFKQKELEDKNISKVYDENSRKRTYTSSCRAERNTEIFNNKSNHVLRKGRITRISTRAYPQNDDEIKLNQNLTSVQRIKNEEVRVKHKHRGKSLNKTCIIDSSVTKTDAKLLISPTVSYSMNADQPKHLTSPKATVAGSDIPIHYMNPSKNKYPPSVAYSLKKFKMKSRLK